MKKSVVLVLVFVLLVVLTGISFAARAPKINADSPLPTEVNIVAPAADIAPELAAFFGTWVGTWKWDFYPDNAHMQRDTVIIVEKIERNSLSLVVSFGPSRPYYRGNNGGWARIIGTYNPITNKVTVPLKSPLTLEDQNATLWINADGKMVGHRNQYIYDGGKASDYKGLYTKQ